MLRGFFIASIDIIQQFLSISIIEIRYFYYFQLLNVF